MQSRENKGFSIQESRKRKGRPPDVVKALQKHSRTMDEVLRQYEADPRLVYKVAETIINRAISGKSDAAWLYLIKNVGIL